MKNKLMIGRTVRLRAFSLLLACLILPSIGQPASAQPKSSQFFDAGFDVTLDFLCVGFDVRVIATGSGKDIALRGDRTISIFPGLHVTVINEDNQSSVTLNVPGSFHTRTNSDESVVTKVTGRNLLFDPEAGFVLAIGTFRFAVDAEGNLIQPLNGNGQLVDICALIE